MQKKITFLSPAKINLCLHVTQRLTNGYHNIQSIMTFLNYGDNISFKLSKGYNLTTNTKLKTADNLITQAVNALQKYNTQNLGIDIGLTKKIPLQAGLGGGSSNAATTLLALNYLWQLNLSPHKLVTIGLKLGADIPFFIYGHTGVVEGRGEKIRYAPLLKKQWLIVFKPPINLSTAAMFTHPQLKIRQKHMTITELLDSKYVNDFMPVIKTSYPQLTAIINRIEKYAPAYLTGTGSCIFSMFPTQDEAKKVQSQLNEYDSFITTNINLSPTASKLKLLN